MKKIKLQLLPNIPQHTIRSATINLHLSSSYLSKSQFLTTSRISKWLLNGMKSKFLPGMYIHSDIYEGSIYNTASNNTYYPKPSKTYTKWRLIYLFSNTIAIGDNNPNDNSISNRALESLNSPIYDRLIQVLPNAPFSIPTLTCNLFLLLYNLQNYESPLLANPSITKLTNYTLIAFTWIYLYIMNSKRYN